MKKDLDNIVNVLRAERIESAWEAFFDKWLVSEANWVKVFKDNLGHLKFARCDTFAGYHIVGE